MTYFLGPYDIPSFFIRFLRVLGFTVPSALTGSRQT